MVTTGNLSAEEYFQEISKKGTWSMSSLFVLPKNMQVHFEGNLPRKSQK
jgi:hypothetical protein